MSMFDKDFIQLSEAIKVAVMHGQIIKYKDVEISDLRFFVRRLRGTECPKIQVYKMNRYGKEICETYFNYDKAVDRYLELVERSKKNNEQKPRQVGL